MNPEHAATDLHSLLAERLRETPGGLWGAARERARRVLRLPARRRADARDADRIERIRILPPPTREALLRYYVFGEAEDSICASLEVSHDDFRRMRAEAREFVLQRRG